jgi:hypothetical protein
MNPVFRIFAIFVTLDVQSLSKVVKKIADFVFAIFLADMDFSGHRI